MPFRVLTAIRLRHSKRPSVRGWASCRSAIPVWEQPLYAPWVQAAMRAHLAHGDEALQPSLLASY